MTTLFFMLKFGTDICSFKIWGRNGFDGDTEAMVAYRVPSPRKKAELDIIADDYNYALAA